MSTLSKSPVYVARQALAVATNVLRPYAHKFSPKLYTQPQLFVCLVGRGPRPDVDRYVPVLKATLRHVRLDASLADAGYDSEANHTFAREEHGVRSFMPATIGRPTPKLPTGHYRRQMKQRLNKHY